MNSIHHKEKNKIIHIFWKKMFNRISFGQDKNNKNIQYLEKQIGIKDALGKINTGQETLN